MNQVQQRLQDQKDFEETIPVPEDAEFHIGMYCHKGTNHAHPHEDWWQVWCSAKEHERRENNSAAQWRTIADILSCRLRELSFAAQTTGGTSGPDRTLMLAIENSLNALQYVDREREAPQDDRRLSVHFDDRAVDKFAAAMKEKLAISRANGRGGWHDPTVISGGDLAAMLVEHVAKGDPVDVANLAMMLHLRGIAHHSLSAALNDYVCAQSNWRTIADMETDSYVGWCWIVYKGSVTAAYRNHWQQYLLGGYHRNPCQTEDITHVMPWQCPAAPAVEGGES